MNATSSLGGDVAGSRGFVDVIVINNTSHHAAFVLGSFDQSDPDFVPDATQFGVDDVGLTLGPNLWSGAISFRCARTFSIGGQRLLDLVEASVDAEEIEAIAFVDGVSFLDLDSEGVAQPAVVGSAMALEALAGLDFNCGSILVFRLELDDLRPGSFRVDFEVIPSASGR